MPWFAIIGVAIAAAASTASAVISSQEQAAAEKTNAKIARNNALATEQAAAFEVERIKRRNLLVYGKQRAQYAKAGVLAGGSADDVIFDSQLQGELDAQAVLYSGRITSNNLRDKASMHESSASSITTLGYINAAGSAFKGASSMYGSMSTQ